MEPTPTQKPTAQLGLLLVGHGTRNTRGQAEFMETAHQVANRLHEVLVEPAFLELSEPTIAQGIERLVARGTGRLIVAPLLLFAAGHAKADIPQAVSRALEPFPDIPVSWTAPFACHEKILELSALRYREAIASGMGISEEESLLVMVGRGSSDTQAIAQMHEFSRQRGEMDQLAHLETCFFARAEPSLALVLKKAVEHSARRVVIQPHLLFEGQLTKSLADQVREIAAICPEKQWIVARHLAPHEILVQATTDIVGSALQQSI